MRKSIGKVDRGMLLSDGAGVAVPAPSGLL